MADPAVIIQKLKKALQSQYGGDVEDGTLKHCIQHFQEKWNTPYERSQWADHMRHIARVVTPTTKLDLFSPLRAETTELWIASWHLGFDEDSGVRGRPKMINVLEVAMSFLDNGFTSQRNPLSITMLKSWVPGDPFENFSIRHTVGFTRSLACKVILDLVHTLGLNDVEMQAIGPLLASILGLKCIYEPSMGEQELLTKSLLSKFQVSESTRPDVLQIYWGFEQCMKREGVNYQDQIEKRIQEFNSKSSVESFKISEAEWRMLILLPSQLDEFRSLLGYHWDQFKAGESAVPLRVLVANVNRKKPDTGIPGLWVKIFTYSAAKNLTFLKREIAIYLKQLKEAQRNSKKPVNLAFRAVSNSVAVFIELASSRQTSKTKHQ